MFVMFFADHNNPYSRLDRFVEFTTAFLTTFCGAGVVLALSASDDYFNSVLAVWGLTLLFATTPTLVIRQIQYYLLACPCIVHDETKTSEAYNCCLSCIAKLGRNCTYLISCLLSVILALLGLACWIEYGETEAESNTGVKVHSLVWWVASAVQTWVLWFPIKFAIEFNPSRCWRKCFGWLSCLSCGLIDIGRWQKQRNFVLNTILEAEDNALALI